MTASVPGRYGALVEQALEEYFPQKECRQSAILSACRYSLLSGGKRLRPALLMEFFRLCGGQPEQALPFACGLEMIHTYSLIHDDLPCMDDDDWRRGKPANHKAFGEAAAVLAGDGLLNRAFEIMLAQRAIPARQALDCAAYLAECSGVYGMIGGQAQDLALEGKPASEEAILEMISLKTGALFRAACVGGCLLAGGSEAQKEAALRYAQALGLAFQLRDDLLDVTGDRALLGKDPGSDQAKGKSTLVALLGAEACEKKIQALTESAVRAAAFFEEEGFLTRLARQLAGRRS